MVKSKQKGKATPGHVTERGKGMMQILFGWLWSNEEVAAELGV